MKPQSGCSTHFSTSITTNNTYCGACKAIEQTYRQHNRLLVKFAILYSHLDHLCQSSTPKATFLKMER